MEIKKEYFKFKYLLILVKMNIFLSSEFPITYVLSFIRMLVPEENIVVVQTFY
jgi:hypothetical protein